MCLELGYAAAYIHSFYMLSCVERYVEIELMFYYIQMNCDSLYISCLCS
jgi:hypothetical protein